MATIITDRVDFNEFVAEGSITKLTATSNNRALIDSGDTFIAGGTVTLTDGIFTTPVIRSNPTQNTGGTDFTRVTLMLTKTGNFTAGGWDGHDQTHIWRDCRVLYAPDGDGDSLVIGVRPVDFAGGETPTTSWSVPNCYIENTAATGNFTINFVGSQLANTDLSGLTLGTRVNFNYPGGAPGVDLTFSDARRNNPTAGDDGTGLYSLRVLAPTSTASWTPFINCDWSAIDSADPQLVADQPANNNDVNAVQVQGQNGSLGGNNLFIIGGLFPTSGSKTSGTEQLKVYGVSTAITPGDRSVRYAGAWNPVASDSDCTDLQFKIDAASVPSNVHRHPTAVDRTVVPTTITNTGAAYNLVTETDTQGFYVQPNAVTTFSTNGFQNGFYLPRAPITGFTALYKSYTHNAVEVLAIEETAIGTDGAGWSTFGDAQQTITTIEDELIVQTNVVIARATQPLNLTQLYEGMKASHYVSNNTDNPFSSVVTSTAGNAISIAGDLTFSNTATNGVNITDYGNTPDDDQVATVGYSATNYNIAPDLQFNSISDAGQVTWPADDTVEVGIQCNTLTWENDVQPIVLFNNEGRLVTGTLRVSPGTHEIGNANITGLTMTPQETNTYTWTVDAAAEFGNTLTLPVNGVSTVDMDGRDVTSLTIARRSTNGGTLTVRNFTGTPQTPVGDNDPVDFLIEKTISNLALDTTDNARLQIWGTDIDSEITGLLETITAGDSYVIRSDNALYTQNAELILVWYAPGFDHWSMTVTVDNDPITVVRTITVGAVTTNSFPTDGNLVAPTIEATWNSTLNVIDYQITGARNTNSNEQGNPEQRASPVLTNNLFENAKADAGFGEGVARLNQSNALQLITHSSEETTRLRQGTHRLTRGDPSGQENIVSVQQVNNINAASTITEIANSGMAPDAFPQVIVFPAPTGVNSVDLQVALDSTETGTIDGIITRLGDEGIIELTDTDAGTTGGVILGSTVAH